MGEFSPHLRLQTVAPPDMFELRDENVVSSVYEEHMLSDGFDTSRFTIRMPMLQATNGFMDSRYVNYQGLVWLLESVTDTTFASFPFGRQNTIMPMVVEREAQYDLIALAAEYDAYEAPFDAKRQPFQRWHKEKISLSTRPFIADLMRERKDSPTLDRKYIFHSVYREEVTANYASITCNVEVIEVPNILKDILDTGFCNFGGLHWYATELNTERDFHSGFARYHLVLRAREDRSMFDLIDIPRAA